MRGASQPLTEPIRGPHEIRRVGLDDDLSFPVTVNDSDHHGFTDLGRHGFEQRLGSFTQRRKWIGCAAKPRNLGADDPATRARKPLRDAELLERREQARCGRPRKSTDCANSAIEAPDDCAAMARSNPMPRTSDWFLG